MNSGFRTRWWIAGAAALLIVVVAAGVSLLSGITTPAGASGGCDMGQSDSGGCAMTNGSANADGSSTSKDSSHGGCAMLTGKVLSVNKREGSITVSVKPVDSGEAAKSTFGQVKVGDVISLAMMTGQKESAAKTDVSPAAAYACPMHPEVTSDKPGSCPKCGMKLDPVKNAGK